VVERRWKPGSGVKPVGIHLDARLRRYALGVLFQGQQTVAARDAELDCRDTGMAQLASEASSLKQGIAVLAAFDGLPSKFLRIAQEIELPVKHTKRDEARRNRLCQAPNDSSGGAKRRC
jgi:hypothetical protein